MRFCPYFTSTQHNRHRIVSTKEEKSSPGGTEYEHLAANPNDDEIRARLRMQQLGAAVNRQNNVQRVEPKAAPRIYPAPLPDGGKGFGKGGWDSDSEDDGRVRPGARAGEPRQGQDPPGARADEPRQGRGLPGARADEPRRGLPIDAMAIDAARGDAPRVVVPGRALLRTAAQVAAEGVGDNRWDGVPNDAVAGRDDGWVVPKVQAPPPAPVQPARDWGNFGAKGMD